MLLPLNLNQSKLSMWHIQRSNGAWTPLLYQMHCSGNVLNAMIYFVYNGKLQEDVEIVKELHSALRLHSLGGTNDFSVLRKVVEEFLQMHSVRASMFP